MEGTVLQVHRAAEKSYYGDCPYRQAKSEEDVFLIFLVLGRMPAKALLEIGLLLVAFSLSCLVLSVYSASTQLSTARTGYGGVRLLLRSLWLLFFLDRKLPERAA